MKENYILLLDTSGDDGIVSVSANSRLLYTAHTPQQRNHASALNGLISTTLEACAIRMSDLTAVAVVGGPGSYTGLRIGLATAKGLCYALDISLLQHNKLSLLAFQSQQINDNTYDHYISILPARSNEYFIAGIAANAEEIIAPTHVTADTLNTLLQPYISSKLLIHTSVDIADDLKLNFPVATYAHNIEIDLNFYAKKAFDDLICNRAVNLYSTEPFYLKAPFTYSKL